MKEKEIIYAMKQAGESFAIWGPQMRELDPQGIKSELARILASPGAAVRISRRVVAHIAREDVAWLEELIGSHPARLFVPREDDPAPADGMNGDAAALRQMSSSELIELTVASLRDITE